MVRFDAPCELEEIHNGATQTMREKNRRLLSACLQQYK
jgi:hypothetical protein